MWTLLRRDARSLKALRSRTGSSPGSSPAWLWPTARSLLLITLFRFAQRFERPWPRSWARRLALLLAKVLVAVANDIGIVAFKSEFSPDTRIEGGVVLSGRGHIILGARFIGRGTIISDRVTVGMDLKHARKPRIGRNVWIGSHCVIFGDIEIGDGAVVMPHTVLTRDVPSGAVVKGNPGRIVRCSLAHASRHLQAPCLDRDILAANDTDRSS